MTASNSGSFGEKFIPGKDKQDRTAASQALTQRWSGRPGYDGGETGSSAPKTRKDLTHNQ